ncbi:Major facilitator superfamily protein [Euphorbia peplus]|nr:Major facilitator superfamily protein [Euphorbia peplus]
MRELGKLRHMFVTVFMAELAIYMVAPTITDVTMSALCSGLDECSLAIYLSGFQQAVTGFGSVVMTPLIGSLSDHYGRKALLTFPLTISILPLGILAYSRDTNFFYAYFVVKTIAAMVSDSSINCLAHAYVADNILAEGRAAAFGVLSGIIMASFVLATFIARFLPSPGLTFQVATLISIIAVVYMRIFLKDRIHELDHLTQPILKSDSPNKNKHSKKIPTIGDVISFLRSSVTFSQLAVVAFFQGLCDGGLQSAAMFYWKARFQYTKNEYANLFLLVGVAGMLSQLILMPLLAARVTEQKLLSFGLFMSFLNMFVYSIAWSDWVPYAAGAALAFFTVLAPPSLRSIVSKQIGPNDQGKAQGCISSISSAAHIISPLIFSPLTALFLSGEAPFNFRGFSILCLGIASMIAFIQSVMIKPGAPTLKHSSNTMEEVA